VIRRRRLWVVATVIILVVAAVSVKRLHDRRETLDRAQVDPGRTGSEATKQKETQSQDRIAIEIFSMAQLKAESVPPPTEPNQYRDPVTTPLAIQPPAPPAYAPPEESKGKMPALVVRFSEIGFSRYAEIVERAGGGFFAYCGRSGLGPRISIAERRLLNSGVTAGMASRHAYLLTDPGIGRAITGMNLPACASASSVVMLWPLTIDRAVWTSIEESLKSEGIQIEAASRAEGSVYERQGATYLRIERVVLHQGATPLILKETPPIKLGQ
jgi:hypothetical protein